MISYPYPQYINQPIQQPLSNYIQPVISSNQYVYELLIFITFSTDLQKNTQGEEPI